MGMQNDCIDNDEMWLQQLPTTPIQPRVAKSLVGKKCPRKHNFHTNEW